MIFIVEEVSVEFRTTPKGVFDENGNYIFVCLPGDRVNSLMNDLFEYIPIESGSNQINHVSTYVKKIVSCDGSGVQYTTAELMNLLGMKSRVSFRDNYLIPSIDIGLIKMTFLDNPTNKNQTYYKD